MTHPLICSLFSHAAQFSSSYMKMYYCINQEYVCLQVTETPTNSSLNRKVFGRGVVSCNRNAGIGSKGQVGSSMMSLSSPFSPIPVFLLCYA